MALPIKEDPHNAAPGEAVPETKGPATPLESLLENAEGPNWEKVSEYVETPGKSWLERVNSWIRGGEEKIQQAGGTPEQIARAKTSGANFLARATEIVRTSVAKFTEKVRLAAAEVGRGQSPASRQPGSIFGLEARSPETIPGKPEVQKEFEKVVQGGLISEEDIRATEAAMARKKKGVGAGPAPEAGQQTATPEKATPQEVPAPVPPPEVGAPSQPPKTEAAASVTPEALGEILLHMPREKSPASERAAEDTGQSARGWPWGEESPTNERAAETQPRKAEGPERAGREKAETPEKEKEEIRKEAAAMPPQEREKIHVGLGTLGFFVEGWKNEGFAKVFGGAAKLAGTRGAVGRFFTALHENALRNAAAAKHNIENAQKGEKKRLASAGFLVGNLLKYGRTAADILGWTIASPLRYAMLGGMTFARGAEAAKEARLHNEEVIEKTRVKDIEEAAEEAWKIYEEAAVGAGDKGVSKEDLVRAYQLNLPQDLLNRLRKNPEPGMATGILQRLMKWDVEAAVQGLSWKGKFWKQGIGSKISRIELNKKLSEAEKKQKVDRILKKYEKYLNDYDRLVTQYGTVDALALGARYAEVGGKAVVYGVMAETVVASLARLFEHHLPDLLHKRGVAVGRPPAPHAAEPRGVPRPTVEQHPVTPAPTPEHPPVAEHPSGEAHAPKVEAPAAPHEHAALAEHPAAQAPLRPAAAEHAPATTAAHIAKEPPSGEQPPAHEIPAGAEKTPVTISIKQGENVWKAAKELVQEGKITQKDFEKAWATSMVSVHGKLEHISHVDLTHPGDEVKFVYDAHGGHIEVTPASGSPLGDSGDLLRAYEHAGKTPPAWLREAVRPGGEHPAEAIPKVSGAEHPSGEAHAPKVEAPAAPHEHAALAEHPAAQAPLRPAAEVPQHPTPTEAAPAIPETPHLKESSEVIGQAPHAVPGTVPKVEPISRGEELTAAAKDAQGYLEAHAQFEDQLKHLKKLGELASHHRNEPLLQTQFEAYRTSLLDHYKDPNADFAGGNLYDQERFLHEIMKLSEHRKPNEVLGLKTLYDELQENRSYKAVRAVFDGLKKQVGLTDAEFDKIKKVKLADFLKHHGPSRPPGERLPLEKGLTQEAFDRRQALAKLITERPSPATKSVRHLSLEAFIKKFIARSQ